MQLVRALPVSRRGLSLTLREVLAFSPSDEFALLWYDTERGDMHGYHISDAIPMHEDGRPLYQELQPAQFESDATRAVRHAIRRQGCSAVDRQSMGRRNTRLATAAASGTPIRTLSPIGAWHQLAWR
jgi:hypothetical protein